MGDKVPARSPGEESRTARDRENAGQVLMLPWSTQTQTGQSVGDVTGSLFLHSLAEEAVQVKDWRAERPFLLRALWLLRQCLIRLA